MNPVALLIPPSLDAKQALRLRRFGIATLSYVLATALIAVAWTFGTSVGISVYPADGQAADALVKAADAAMYSAKQAGNTLRLHAA